MKRSKFEGRTTVYQYGCPHTSTFDANAERQLRLAHDLRNSLVEIERTHADAVAAVWATQPRLATIETQVEAAEAALAEVIEDTKNAKKAGRGPATSIERGAVKDLRATLKTLRAKRRDIKAATYERLTPRFTALRGERQAAIKALYGDYVQTRGLFWACVDEQTEIMTRDGWKHHHEVDAGTEVLTLDHDTGLSAWQAVSGVHRYEVDDVEMHAMDSTRHSSLTTLNHRWPVLTTTGRDRRPLRNWQVSETLAGYDGLITGAVLAEPPTEPKWSDALVELVAWFYTEGSCQLRPGRNAPRVCITQSHTVHPEMVDRIRASLTALYGPPSGASMGGGWDAGRRRTVAPRWREITARADLTRFVLSKTASEPLRAIAPDRVVGLDFVQSLTRAQLRLFLETSIDADGHRKASGSGLMEIAQKVPARLDAVELAAILLGYSVRRYKWMTGTPRIESTMLSISRRTHTAVSSQSAERIRYTGTVWCVTTPNETWLARRNGRVHFTGNTFNDVSATHDTAVKSMGAKRKAGMPAELRFHRWTGEGTLAVQLQRGGGEPFRTPDVIADTNGAYRNVVHIPFIPELAWGELTYVQQKRARLVRMRVRTGADEQGQPQWLTIPILIHRPIPDDGDISDVRVTRRKIGPRYKITVAVTVRLPAVIEQPDDGPMVALDLGWRMLADGALRVGVFATREPMPLRVAGNPRGDAHHAIMPFLHSSPGGLIHEVILPREYLAEFHRVEGLRSTRDERLNAVKAVLAEWLQGALAPVGTGKKAKLTPLGDALTALEVTPALVRQWRSARAVAGYVGRLRPILAGLADPSVTDKDMLATAEAWLAQDLHLWDWEANLRDQLIARRRDVYRNIAAAIVDAAGTVIVEEFNVAKLAARPAVEEADSAQAKAARSNRTIAAPAELRSCLEIAAARRGVRIGAIDAAYSTRVHAPCGTLIDGDFAAAIDVYCPTCGRTFDQDVNAAQNLIAVAVDGVAEPALV